MGEAVPEELPVAIGFIEARATHVACATRHLRRTEGKE